MEKIRNNQRKRGAVMITALFVQKNGCYYGRDNIDPWDEERDARKYSGNNPVIAHPPCQRWCKMANVNYARWGGDHNKVGNDGGCFESALNSVRKHGGVLEHPAQTYAWNKYNLEKPIKGCWIKCMFCDGWVCEVWQSAYGHKANKATWLYYCGDREPYRLRWNRPKGTHQVGFHDQRGKEFNKPTLSKKESNATPIEFMQELIGLAEWATTNGSEARR